MKKERHIPASYSLHYIHEATEFVVYTHESVARGKIVAMAFAGRAAKPLWHYIFGSAERLAEKIKSQVESLEAHKAMVAERRKARFAPHKLVGGEVFRTSWGYEQTNVEYYEVVSVCGQTVELREIAQSREEEGYLCGKTKPMPGMFIGEAFSRRVSMVGGSPSVKIHQSATAYYEQPITMTSGKPVYKERYWSSYY
jgi:hypothetical protein